MNTIHLKRVRRIFANEWVPQSTVRHNQLQWVRMVRMLGDKWRALPVNPTPANRGIDQ
jgi:hypothetical protein